MEPEHIRHCFSYLRQGIMCNADTTIEWARVELENRTRVSADGWGVPHNQCKDVRVVEDFLYENRYFDENLEKVYHEPHTERR